MAKIQNWKPEDPTFWAEQGSALAWRTCGVTTFSLIFFGKSYAWLALVIPTCTLPKASDVGVTLAACAVPVPDSVTVCVPAPSFSVSVATRCPE